VYNGNALSVARERRLQLYRASGISCRDHIGFQRLDETSFAISDGVGSVRLDEIVNACGTAADGGFRDLGKLEFGDFRKKGPRLRSHTLCVLQVARIVKGHAEFERVALGTGVETRENFADIFAFCGETSSALRIGWVIPQ